MNYITGQICRVGRCASTFVHIISSTALAGESRLFIMALLCSIVNRLGQVCGFIVSVKSVGLATSEDQRLSLVNKLEYWLGLTITEDAIVVAAVFLIVVILATSVICGGVKLSVISILGDLSADQRQLALRARFGDELKKITMSKSRFSQIYESYVNNFERSQLRAVRFGVSAAIDLLAYTILLTLTLGFLLAVAPLVGVILAVSLIFFAILAISISYRHQSAQYFEDKDGGDGQRAANTDFGVFLQTDDNENDVLTAPKSCAGLEEDVLSATRLKIDDVLFQAINANNNFITIVSIPVFAFFIVYLYFVMDGSSLSFLNSVIVLFTVRFGLQFGHVLVNAARRLSLHYQNLYIGMVVLRSVKAEGLLPFVLDQMNPNLAEVVRDAIESGERRYKRKEQARNDLFGMLDYLRSTGAQAVPLRRLDEMIENKEYCIVLRHDVQDVSPTVLYKYAQEHADRGLFGTFFFPTEGHPRSEGVLGFNEQGKVMRQIQEMGHEIGLNFDPSFEIFERRATLDQALVQAREIFSGQGIKLVSGNLSSYRSKFRAREGFEMAYDLFEELRRSSDYPQLSLLDKGAREAVLENSISLKAHGFLFWGDSVPWTARYGFVAMSIVSDNELLSQNRFKAIALNERPGGYYLTNRILPRRELPSGGRQVLCQRRVGPVGSPSVGSEMPKRQMNEGAPPAIVVLRPRFYC